MGAMSPGRGEFPVAIALVGIFVGSLVGFLLLPNVVSQPEDLQLAAIVFAAGIATGPIVAALRQPQAILHPTSILLLGIIYWLLFDLIQARFAPEVSNPDAIGLGFMAIALFVVGVCVAQYARPPSFPRLLVNAATFSFSSRALFRIGLAAFALSFLRFAAPAEFDLVRMYEALFQHRWAAPWARGQFGGWDAVLDHFAYFGYLLPALSVLLYRSEGRFSIRVALLAFFAVVIGLLVAQGGGRRIIGALVASGGVVWVMTSRNQVRSVFAMALIVVPALLTYLQFILLTRGSGLESFDDVDVGDLFAQGIHIDDNFNRLCQVIELIPASHPHVGLSWLIWIVSRPIPRVLWPGKPEGVGFDLASFQGIEGVSLTISIVGESYMAFGFIGTLATGFVFGYLGRVLARFLTYGQSSGAVLIYAVGLLALFVGLRSAIEVVLFSYAILAWIVLTYWISRKESRRAVVPVARNHRL